MAQVVECLPKEHKTEFNLQYTKTYKWKTPQRMAVMQEMRDKESNKAGRKWKNKQK
jgi:hypothetical protein